VSYVTLHNVTTDDSASPRRSITNSHTQPRTATTYRHAPTQSVHTDLLHNQPNNQRPKHLATLTSQPT
jgi:hypothetical protein